MAKWSWLRVTLALSVLGVATLVSSATCPVSSDLRVTAKLKATIFCNYDRYLRPVLDRQKNVLVNISLDLKYLSLEEFSSQMVVHSWVVCVWKDENLKWKPEDYENITYLIVPSDDIWIPDLSIYNSDLSQIMLFSSTTCVLYSSGTIKCAPDLRTPVYCDHNLARWPYDTQTCALLLGSWAHTGEEIDIQLQDDVGYRKYLFMESNAWQLLNITAAKQVSVYCCPNSTYPHLTYNFAMKRHAAMFAASIVAPAFVLAGITLLSFWVRGVGSRALVCCTSLIGDVLFLQYIGFHLPADGDTSPDIVAFYRDAMILTMIALVIALLVERSRDQELTSGLCGEAPGWLTGSATWLRGRGGRAGQLLLGEIDEEGDQSTQTTTDVESANKIPLCSAFANFLDRVSFLILFIIFSIMLLALLP